MILLQYRGDAFFCYIQKRISYKQNIQKKNIYIYRDAQENREARVQFAKYRTRNAPRSTKLTQSYLRSGLRFIMQYRIFHERESEKERSGRIWSVAIIRVFKMEIRTNGSCSRARARNRFLLSSLVRRDNCGNQLKQYAVLPPQPQHIAFRVSVQASHTPSRFTSISIRIALVFFSYISSNIY